MDLTYVELAAIRRYKLQNIDVFGAESVAELLFERSDCFDTVWQRQKPLKKG